MTKKLPVAQLFGESEELELSPAVVSKPNFTSHSGFVLPLPPESRFHSVKQALHTSIPERLLSRDSEQAAIRSFLHEKLLQQQPGSLYISGAPGTGKTACVKCVLKEMRVRKPAVSLHCHIVATVG